MIVKSFKITGILNKLDMTEECYFMVMKMDQNVIIGI